MLRREEGSPSGWDVGVRKFGSCARGPVLLGPGPAGLGALLAGANEQIANKPIVCEFPISITWDRDPFGLSLPAQPPSCREVKTQRRYSRTARSVSKFQLQSRAKPCKALYFYFNSFFAPLGCMQETCCRTVRDAAGRARRKLQP